MSTDSNTTLSTSTSPSITYTTPSTRNETHTTTADTGSCSETLSKSHPNRRQIVIVDDVLSELQSTSRSIISTSTSSLNSSSTSGGATNSISTSDELDLVPSSFFTDPLLVKSLVCNFFESQFSLKGESCELLPQTDSIEELSYKPSREFQEVAAALRELGQQYVRLYEDRIQIIIEQFQQKVECENVAQSFEFLSKEFFREGINWHFILTYFVFSAEIAQYASRSGLASVDDIAGWLINFIDAHLSSWIRQNGGWIGFRKYFVEKGFLSNDNSNNSDSNASKVPFVFGTAVVALILGCYLKSFWNRP